MRQISSNHNQFYIEIYTHKRHITIEHRTRAYVRNRGTVIRQIPIGISLQWEFPFRQHIHHNTERIYDETTPIMTFLISCTRLKIRIRSWSPQTFWPNPLLSVGAERSWSVVPENKKNDKRRKMIIASMIRCACIWFNTYHREWNQVYGH